MNNFRVGQKVVCVDDRYGAYSAYLIGACMGQGQVDLYVKRGAIYTIREIGCVHRCAPSLLCVRVAEIKSDDEDSPFAAARFRPVVECKTDISVFQKLLQPALVEISDLKSLSRKVLRRVAERDGL